MGDQRQTGQKGASGLFSGLKEHGRKTLARNLQALKDLQDFSTVNMRDWPEDLSDLSNKELKALRGGLHLEAEIAAALDRKAQRERKYGKYTKQAETPEQKAQLLEQTLNLMESLLSDPAAVLRVPVQDKIDKRSLKQLRNHYTNQIAGQSPGINVSSGVAATQSLIGNSIVAARRSGLSTSIEIGVPASYVERPLNTFSDQELAVFRCASILRAHNRYTEIQYNKILMALAWGGGQGFVDPGGESKYSGVVQEIATKLLSSAFPDTIHACNRWLGEYQAFIQDEDSDVTQALKQVLSVGQAWGAVSDLPQHRLRVHNYGDLALGQLDNVVLGFNGNESLVTFGPPGRGKSQAHALLNLLTYPGPMVVLDFKGELFEASAGYRQKEMARGSSSFH